MPVGRFFLRNFICRSLPYFQDSTENTRCCATSAMTAPMKSMCLPAAKSSVARRWQPKSGWRSAFVSSCVASDTKKRDTSGESYTSVVTEWCIMSERSCDALHASEDGKSLIAAPTAKATSPTTTRATLTT